MKHLFVSPDQFTSPVFVITGADAHHLIQVVRMRIGQELAVTDGSGTVKQCEVTEVTKREIRLRVLSSFAAQPEPSLKITLAQVIGKGDKFETVLQHGAEVGIAHFIPVVSDRSVVKIDQKSIPGKLERWGAILKGAAEQSGRAIIPSIEPVMNLDQLLKNSAELDPLLFLHVGCETLTFDMCRQCVASGKVTVIVGPEGGFSEREIKLAIEKGAKPISLGPHVLRTETAALVAASQLLFCARNLP